MVHRHAGAEPVSVLVVDDDRAATRLLALTLEAEDMRVREAADGASAIREVADDTPDLVLLDLQLPDINGHEVFRRIRAIGYDGPIVIVSAHGAHAARRDLGADAAVEKPFDPVVLLRHVTRLLSPE